MTPAIQSLFSLDGRVAIVTGASRGIGAAIAAGLADAGASVTGIARSPVQGRGDVDGPDYRVCDVTDSGAFETLCGETAARHGRLDILVNAAGITVPKGEPGDRLAAFNRTVDVNLRAAYACALAVADHMAGNGGSIINVTSIASVLGFPDNPGYVASKGGLRLLTKALAVDLGGRNIRVNNLAPGYVRTAMTEASHDDPERYRQRLRHTALGRWGEPEDLVGAAVFLASDASAYVTGQDLFVDGGWTAKGLA